MQKLLRIPPVASARCHGPRRCARPATNFPRRLCGIEKKKKKGNSSPRRTPSRRGQDPPGPPTEFATHRLGVERGVSPGRSDLFSCVCSKRRDIFVRRESHRGSTGRVSPRRKLIANGGIQWCVANARIKSGGLEVLGRRSTRQGEPLGAQPTLASG